MKKKSGKRNRSKEFEGYPIGTIAFYGPNDTFASKVAVGYIDVEDGEPDVKSWKSQTTDVRFDKTIGREILEYLQSRNVKSVVATEGIIGCPHEEGIDYPEGEYCPECLFWIGKDRFTGETIN